MLNQGSAGMDMGGNSLKYQVGKVILHTVWIQIMYNITYA